MVIELPAEIESQFEAFARSSGQSTDQLVREALLSYLEDREDAAIAAQRYASGSQRIPLEEIGHKYGLAD
jgi:predicted DNA-binding protein